MLKRYHPILSFILLLLLPQIANSSFLETLMMPGELIEGHAKYETECNECHEPLDKTKQTQLCNSCHKKVASDIDKKKGFHGKNKHVENRECKTCHTDHKGRKADIVHFNKDLFNHDDTDLPLKGVHRKTRCNACHKEEKKYREAPSLCFDCHEKNDRHQGNLGKKCHDCHDAKAWSKTDYDHNETDYPLKGKHKKVTCQSCHPNEQYKEISTRCSDCHQLNDIHAGRYGQKCKECHTVKGWNKQSFDHDIDTEYKLLGRHKKASCSSCHKKGNVYKKKTSTKCFSCHETDDEHKGQYGKKCKECHSVKGWEKSKYDHDKETDFKLKGSHKELTCHACHRGKPEEEELATDCFSCHQQDDIHIGQQGKNCQRCHNNETWLSDIQFDHDLSRFPLIGLHSTTPCEECHLSSAFKGAATVCISCHKQNDEHEKALGIKCESCHNPNSWSLWRFDHNTQSDYELDGSHEGLECNACHKEAVKEKIELSTQCGSCHQQDDFHDGQFGNSCERCHNTKDFNEIVIKR